MFSLSNSVLTIVIVPWLLFFGFVEVFGIHLFDISVREDVKSVTRSVELSKFSMSKKLLHYK